MLLRLPSIALGILTILLTFRSAQVVARDPWTPVVAAAVVASLPRFVFLSAVVNNDTLIATLGTLATLPGSIIVTAVPTRGRDRWLLGAALVTVLGLVVLTKVSSLSCRPSGSPPRRAGRHRG